MIEEQKLKLFEKYLHNLGDERELAKSEHKYLGSVFDEKTNSVENQRRALKDIIQNVLKQENIYVESEMEEDPFKDDDVDELFESVDEADIENSLESEDANAAALSTEPVEEIEEIEDDISSLEEDEFSDIDSDDSEQKASQVYPGDFSLPPQYQAFDSSATTLLSYEQVFSSVSASAAVGGERDWFGGSDISVPDEVKTDSDMLLADDAKFKAAQEYKSIRDFSDEDAELFFENLDKYNIAIRKAVLIILSDEEISYFAERLVDLIFDAAAPQTVQRECEKLLVTDLPRPQDYTVYTADDLQQRLQTRAEDVRKSVHTITTRVLPMVAGVALFLFFGFFFAVQPIRSLMNYYAGLRNLKNREYIQSEQQFQKASDIWSMQGFYFRYADEYQKQRKYKEVKKKYLQLVFGLSDAVRIPLQQKVIDGTVFSNVELKNNLVPADSLIYYSRKGFLKLGAFTADVEGNFKEATAYYNAWIHRHPQDGEFHIVLADTFIDWFDAENNRDALERAHELYDKVVILQKNDDTSLIARTRYSIRVRDEAYLDKIFKSILFANPDYPPKFLPKPYTELVIYKLEKNQPGYVADILDIIAQKNPSYLHLNYLYGKYYRQISESAASADALKKAQQVYEQHQESLRGTDLFYAIDTDVALGDVMLNGYDNILLSKNFLLRAQRDYENLKPALRNADQKTNLARLYVLESQIAVLENKLPLAREYALQARNNNYMSPALDYQQGVIEYLSKNYDDASDVLLRLVDSYNLTVDTSDTLTPSDSFDAFAYRLQYPDLALEHLQKNKINVLFAAANALYFSHNYASSALYYEDALNSMKNEAQVVSSLLFSDIRDKPDEYKAMQRILYAKNNLGVSLYHLFRNGGGSQLRARAINQLVEANTIAQNANRDAPTGARRIIPDVPQYNINAIVRDTQNMRVYSDILLTLSGTTPRYYSGILDQLPL